MKFENLSNRVRIAIVLFFLLRGLLALVGGASEKAATVVSLATVAGAWTLIVVSRWLIVTSKQSRWLYRLYRYRSPASSDISVGPPLPQGILERLYQRIRPPKWCRKSDDALMIIYRDQDKLRREGTIALGVLVQANMSLFEKGGANAPANVLYTTDTEIEHPVHKLAVMADKIFSLKNTKPDDPDEKKFAGMVSYEFGRDFRVSVPDRLSQGLDVTYTTIMIHRKHLPYGYLTNAYFPLLIHTESRAAMILPARYWASELIETWEPQETPLVATEALVNARAGKPEQHF